MADNAANRVILVMKQPGNVRVLQQAVAEIDLAGIGVRSERELRRELAQGDHARTALVDVSGFGQQVWKLCAMLKQSEVPFIVLATAGQLRVGAQCLAYGAVSVLQKPVAKPALMQLVQSLHAR